MNWPTESAHSTSQSELVGRESVRVHFGTHRRLCPEMKGTRRTSIHASRTHCVRLSVCPSDGLFVCPSVRLSVCLFVRWPACRRPNSRKHKATPIGQLSSLPPSLAGSQLAAAANWRQSPGQCAKRRPTPFSWPITIVLEPTGSTRQIITTSGNNNNKKDQKRIPESPKHTTSTRREAKSWPVAMIKTLPDAGWAGPIE